MKHSEINENLAHVVEYHGCAAIQSDYTRACAGCLASDSMIGTLESKKPKNIIKAFKLLHPDFFETWKDEIMETVY